MANVEGDFQRLDQRTYRVLMQEAHEQDTVSDLRERVVVVLGRLAEKEAAVRAVEE